ncbi:MAG: hypothetical protein HQL69_23590 [Magnetococcales bacterium]|nr:hypothetical protein [Magnetococcales bacterium]
MRMSLHQKSFVKWLVLCLIFGGGLAAESHFSDTLMLSSEVEAGNQVEEVNLVSLDDKEPLDAYPITLNSPLFSKSRKPVVVKKKPIIKQVKQAPVAIVPPKIQLTGVLLLEENRQALIRRDLGGTTEWVAEKDKVEEWVLERVLPTSIILRHGEQTEKVHLDKGNAANNSNLLRRSRTTNKRR